MGFGLSSKPWHRATNEFSTWQVFRILLEPRLLCKGTHVVHCDSQNVNHVPHGVTMLWSWLVPLIMILNFSLNNWGLDLGIVIAMADTDWALAMCQALKPGFSMSFSFNSYNPRTSLTHITDEGTVGQVLKGNVLVSRGAQALIQACLKSPGCRNPNLCFHLICESSQFWWLLTVLLTGPFLAPLFSAYHWHINLKYYLNHVQVLF